MMDRFQRLIASPNAFNAMDKPLVRKLTLVLLLKIMLLAGFWWFFVREQRVAIDADHVAAQFLQGVRTPVQGVKP
jgi:hypothetical protein